MVIKDQVSVLIPVDDLWTIMATDFPRVARCLPGLQEITVVDNQHFNVVLSVRVGPLALNFIGVMAQTSFDSDARQMIIDSKAVDKKMSSSVSIQLNVSIRPEHQDTTVIDISSSVDVKGKLASLGWGLIQPKSRTIIKEFGTNLQELRSLT